jgi:hypothetical protein
MTNPSAQTAASHTGQGILGRVVPAPSPAIPHPLIFGAPDYSTFWGGGYRLPDLNYDGVDWKHAYDIIHSSSTGEVQSLVGLNIHELAFLRNTVAIIDLQNGCPTQCLACGRSAPKFKPKDSMPWDRVDALSQTMRRLKKEAHLDLLYPSSRLIAFDGSDPTYYRVVDREGIERHYADVDKSFAWSEQPLVYTTSGWPHGSESLNRGVEAYLARGKRIYYSVKPFGRLFRADVDRYIDRKLEVIFMAEERSLMLYFLSKQTNVDYQMELIGEIRDKYGAAYLKDPEGFKFNPEYMTSYGGDDWFWYQMFSSAEEFLMSSRYTRMVIENMKLLGTNGAQYLLYHLDESDLKRLPDHLKRFEHFFSAPFVRSMFKYCCTEAKNGVIVPSWDQNFKGFGDNSNELGVRAQSTHLYFSEQIRNGLLTMSEYEMDGRITLDPSQFHVHITHDGTIHIRFGADPENLGSVEVKKEYFLRRAKYHENTQATIPGAADAAATYRMMAGLIGKKIFR